MEKKFTSRQLLIYSAITAVVTAAILSVLFFSWNILNHKSVISFDSSKVSSENVKKFTQVWDILNTDYYKKTDGNAMIEGAVSGLANSFNDPYTVYFNKEQMTAFIEKAEGSYSGIGISVNSDSNGILNVIEPFEGSPAKAAGIKQGDMIISVDGKDVTAIKDEAMVISMIKGDENTKVSIYVYRPSQGKYILFNLIRKIIKVTNIYSEVLQNNIGYIRINMFDSEIARYFETELNKLISLGIRGLIIDVRDNPGGSYDQVIKIADRLIPEGLIVYTEDRNKSKEEQKSDKIALDLPIAILINGNSASASEILAGAIKDNKKGILVGTKTFGKGLVQELKMLDDGSGMKVTVSRYFTPSGVCIQGIGIKPDIQIKSLDKYKDSPVSEIPKNEDEQLKAAINALFK